MQRIVRNILKAEAPDLARLVEFRPRHELPPTVAELHADAAVENLLHKVPIFDNLAPEELVSLADIGEYVSIPAGHVIFNEGDEGDTGYVILKGNVNVVRRNDEGEDIVIATLGLGEVFGELALIDGEPRSAGAVSATVCDLFIIERDPFINALTGTPRMLGDFMVGLTGRLRQTSNVYFNATLQQERLRIQGELERHRQISQMVSGVAHEINTPIGIANHAASIVGDELTAERIPALAKDDAAAGNLADLAEAAKLIQNNIARADTLIKSFKNLSVHQAVDSRESVDLAELTTEVVGLYDIKAKTANIDLNIVDERSDTDTPWEGFPGPCSQIILNLLSNAGDYAYANGDGGNIDVVLQTRDDNFSVTVRDFCAGIPEENLKIVWEPFFTTGRESGGSGLGLAIVRNIVTGTLGGIVEIKSTVDEGTAVTFQFPMKAPKSDAEKEAS